MTAFYLWAMRSASIILFVIALVLLFGGALPMLMMIKQSASDLYRDSSVNGNWLIIQALVNGLSNAAWPLFGAALLWRADRFLGSSTEAAE